MTGIFENAHVVGQDVPSSRYLTQEQKRGEPGYVMSRSDLMEFAHCPHRWRKGFHEESSEASEWGTLIDCMIFMPTVLHESVAIIPNEFLDDSGKLRNTKEYKVWKESVAGGRTRIKQAGYDSALRAVNAIRNDYDATCLLENAKTQVMVCGEYHDEETELTIPVKALLDIVPDAKGRFGKALADFKTCNDASPGAWSKTVWKWGWHVQAAMYLDLYCAATGEDRVDWLHLIQESFEPFEVGRRVIDSDFVRLGRFQYQDALRRYAWSLKNDIWPDYDDVNPSAIPGWTIISPEIWMEERVKTLMARLPILEPMNVPLKPAPEDLSEVIP